MYRYTREDVDRSYHQGHHGDPMVNVKVYGDLRDGFAQFCEEEVDFDPRFTQEWVEENLSDETLEGYFQFACESEWEYAQGYAEEIFGGHVKVYGAGRSSGWAVVTGLGDVDEWDAVALAKWRKFEKYATSAAKYIPGQMVSLIYINAFEWAQTEAAERESAANMDVATHG
jgi:hypothetical protein